MYTPLYNHPIFHDFTKEEIDYFIEHIQTKVSIFQKDECIIGMYEQIHQICILLEGHASIYKLDTQGKEILLSQIQKNHIFAEAFVCSGENISQVCVIANTSCKVLQIHYPIVSEDEKIIQLQTKYLQNLLKILSKKSLVLNQKISILSNHKIRQRLFAFFMQYQNEKDYFTIPFSREELAAYLCVERSALSKELAHMKKEGLIDYHKNHFRCFYNT